MTEDLDELTTFIDRLAGRIMRDLIGQPDADTPSVLDRILDPYGIVAVLPVVPRDVYVWDALDNGPSYYNNWQHIETVELVGVAVTRDGIARSVIIASGVPEVLDDVRYYTRAEQPRAHDAA